MDIFNSLLVKKLGLRVNAKIILRNQPDNYFGLLGITPTDLVWFNEKEESLADFIHLFYFNEDELLADLERFKNVLQKNGMMWISWPKKGSGIPSNLDREKVRQLGLKAGLVDVKICSIDANWSALKFVFRLKDRL